MDAKIAKLLRDYKATGDPEAGARLFHYGQQLEYEIHDYQAIGAPWQLYLDNIWQLNENITNPQQTADYLSWLLKKHPHYQDYIEYLQDRPMPLHFMKTQEDWHPCFPAPGINPRRGGYIRLYVDFVGDYEYRKKNSGWGKTLRVAFWGADDSGMELDVRSPWVWAESCLMEFPEIISRYDLEYDFRFKRA